MAPPAGTLRVGRYFLALLAIFAVLYAIVFWPGQRHTPKLGIDLAGGQQVTFTAKSTNGNAPTKSQMQEAKDILTERVNGNGLTQSEVVIQYPNQLIVSIPGSKPADIADLGKAAQLNMRPLVMPATPSACTPATTTPATSASGSSTSPASGSSSTPSTATTPTTSSSSSPAAPKDAGARPLVAAASSSAGSSSAGAATSGSSTAKASGNASISGSAAPTTPAASGSTAAAPPTCTATPFKGLAFTVPPNEKAFDTLTAEQQGQLTTALSTMDCSPNTLSAEVDNAKTYFIACDTSGYVYLLGPTIIHGTQISSASAQNGSSGNTVSAEWTVALNFKPSGQAAWANYTKAHNIGDASGSNQTASAPTCGSTMTASGGDGSPCADFVGFTLDGVALSVPVNLTVINGGTTQISGNFTQSSANQLAKQLKYGALPLSFTAGQDEQVSATLGSSQLKAGLLAGGIGLILVVIYSLIYYRALGLVTIASLIVSAGLTYGSLVMLATQINFTLSLAGIAGFIVAIGITADSFVVFFERMKDEVHEGRSIRVAVPRAWVRARRTILSADTVSFLAAAILYYFAAGDVKGFAFTLGLSTILDLVVVFLFTHPLVSLLSRSRAFGSARFTGLNAVRDGGIAISDAEEREAERASRRSRPAATEPRAASDRFAGVAVMDRRTQAPGGQTDEDAEATLAEPAEDTPIEDTRLEDGAVKAAEPVGEVEQIDATQVDIDTDSGDDDSPPAPRRRSVPEPGSAAERAAARRARLRGEKGSS